MRVLIISFAFSALLASVAHADPCKAIADNGKAPAWVKVGAQFTGTVRYIADGDGLCVGASADPATWVEVRLADFYSPELKTPEGVAAKAALGRIAMGKATACTVVRGNNGKAISYDRVIARCVIDGEDIGDLMRRDGVREGGNGR